MMNVQWLRDSVMTIASICMTAALVECICDGERESGLRIVCGAAVSAAVLNLAVSGLRSLL